MFGISTNMQQSFAIVNTNIENLQQRVYKLESNSNSSDTVMSSANIDARKNITDQLLNSPPSVQV